MSDTIAKSALSITDIILKTASFGKQALPVAEFIAGFIPGGGVVVNAIKIAGTSIALIDKYGPAVREAIQAGSPIIDAIEENGPDVLVAFKNLYAIAVNHDPERIETAMTAEDVSGDEFKFAMVSAFGHRWTDEETQRWWARASDNVG